MKGFNKRVFEMLGRILVFVKDFPRYFAKDTEAGKAVAEIQAAVDRLSAHDSFLEGGAEAIQTALAGRTHARAALLDYMERTSRTAKGLQLGQFPVPRGRSDVALASVARLWAAHLKPFEQRFADCGMPNFMEKLESAIGDVQRAIDDQTSS